MLLSGATRVLVPGYCTGDLAPIARGRRRAGRTRTARLAASYREFFGRDPTPTDYGSYDIEIIAEINHCPRLSLDEILTHARQLAADGADVIDVGCEPEGPWAGVADVVRALRDAGHRVSIDSLDPREIEPAFAPVRNWFCLSTVPIAMRPAIGDAKSSWCRTIRGRWRGWMKSIDDVGRPPAFDCGSTRCWSRSGSVSPSSLGRYLQVRERYPDAEMMMGIGNLTELTDADSAAINVVLLGFCEELGIRSVLTTQVINWARSSVRECDLARRLVYHSIQHRVLPKHLEPRLVMLRDPAVTNRRRRIWIGWHAKSKTPNYRVFVSGGEVHIVSHELHLHDADPFLLFEQLRQSGPDGGLPKNLDAAHSFYLGYEMCKAATATTFGKQYQQDESLDWGFLTREESRHYLQARPNPLERS